MSAEPTISRLAESAAVKLLFYVITSIAIPAVGFGMNSILETLRGIDKQLASFATTTATTEIRLRALESSDAAQAATINRHSERLSDSEHKLERLEEILGRRRQ